MARSAPREVRISKGEFSDRGDETIGGGKDSENTTEVVLRGDGRAVRVKREGDKVISAVFAETGKPVASEGWKVRYETNADRKARFMRRNPGEKSAPDYVPRAVIYQTRFSGLLQGDLGRSMVYNDPVHEMIFSRMPIAVYFGLLTAFLTYAVCLPLGVLKALETPDLHRLRHLGADFPRLLDPRFRARRDPAGPPRRAHEPVPALRPDQPGFRRTRHVRARSRTSRTTRCCR